MIDNTPRSEVEAIGILKEDWFKRMQAEQLMYNIMRQESLIEKMRPYSDYMKAQVNKEIAYSYGYFTSPLGIYYKVHREGFWEISDTPTGCGNTMIFTLRLDEALECFRNQPDIFPDFDPEIYKYYRTYTGGNNAINKAMYGMG